VRVRKGARVAILNFGALLHEAMAAGDTLDATVADMRWVKPLDRALILELAAEHELLVTLEENVIAGGAGSAVAELLAIEGITNVAWLPIGIPDQFVDHASQSENRVAAGLTQETIVSRVTERLSSPVTATPQVMPIETEEAQQR
jgi:1-deoxy-D-xylulose-5-phosphate synthase